MVLLSEKDLETRITTEMIDNLQQHKLPENVDVLADAVKIWMISVKKHRRYIPYLRKMLSEDEICRAFKYHFDSDRERYIIRRGMLRVILSHYLYEDAHKIMFAYNSFGKPEISESLNPYQIKFNLSHSGDFIVFAITSDQNVGIDVEYIRPIDDMTSIINRFFTSTEKMTFRTMPDSRKVEAFYKWWTQKEAVMKAIGTGISFGFEEFSVNIDPDKPAGLLNVEANAIERFRLVSWKPVYGFIAVLAVKERDFGSDFC